MLLTWALRRGTEATARRQDDRRLTMTHRIFTTSFASVYPLYVAKAERKNRTKGEVDQIIRWLTGYDADGLERALTTGADFATFFAEAPAFTPHAHLITGMICGYRVEEIEDPLMQKIRYLDKLIDELAKGRKLATILRGGGPGEQAPARPTR
jgi:hypothetical protein